MAQSPAQQVLVIIPTYNEKDNLPVVVPALLSSLNCHVLVVDDNSPDGTGKVADSLARHDDRVHVLHRTAKEGLGAAYLAGFAWGLARSYSILCEMDADGSHRPQDAPLLIEAMQASRTTLMAVGSRWVPGGKVENWPWYRHVLSRAGNMYVKLMLRLPVRDATAGFRAYRSSALSQIDFSTIHSHGYCFQVDMTRHIDALEGTVAEVPITFVERTMGESKMNGRIVREALWRVTLWGFARVLPGKKKPLITTGDMSCPRQVDDDIATSL